jgi:hypothetical protein
MLFTSSGTSLNDFKVSVLILLKYNYLATAISIFASLAFFSFSPCCLISSSLFSSLISRSMSSSSISSSEESASPFCLFFFASFCSSLSYFILASCSFLRASFFSKFFYILSRSNFLVSISFSISVGLGSFPIKDSSSMLVVRKELG